MESKDPYERGRATTIELDNGALIYADKIISTAGAVETARLCTDQLADAESENIGQLSFTETITVLDKQPTEFGWNDTIIFFNTAERFRYAHIENDLVDPSSGVIVFPTTTNMAKIANLASFLRVTAGQPRQMVCSRRG